LNIRSEGRGAGTTPGIVAIVLALTFGMNMVARGFSETFAVFLLPVQDTFGWTRSEMTGVYSVYMLVHGLGAPVAGLMFDRLGPRLLYALGLGFLGGGFLLAAEMQALWHYYACIGVMVGLGVAAIGMVPASALISRWFTRRLGTVMGLAYAALGAGVLVLLPVTQLLLDHYAWQTVYRILGATVLSLLVLPVVLPFRRMAAGGPAWRQPRTADMHGQAAPWTLAAAGRTGAFWGLFNVYFFTALSAYSILPQAVAYLVESGFAPLTAASAFGFTGMLSVVGMVSVGWLSDRFGRRRVVTISYTCSLIGIVSLIAVAWMPALVLVYGFVLFFGIAQGARGPVVSTLTAVLFAGRGMGSIYGAITMGLGLGAAVGSWLSGLLHEWTDAYLASFLLGAAGSALGLLQFWVVRALAVERPRAPPADG